jgi:hypothetical protein
MNLAQRIVLIAGALLLLLVLASTESHRYYSESSQSWNVVWDWHAALVRCGVSAIAIVAVYFAVGKRKP